MTKLRVACGCLLCWPLVACNSYTACDATHAQLAQRTLPQRLSETGLYSDLASSTLASDVRAYEPEFALWSDNADKRRYMALPPGSQIDSSDMDDWVFPTGTRLWKEFSLGGKKLETRLLQKVGADAGDWAAVAYVWNDDGSDAHAEPLGVSDIRGTHHDAPSAGECFGCHGGRRGRVLGFSALQLAHDPKSGELALAELATTARLTRPPASPLVVPGNATERAALGYLHANCSGCHNQHRPERKGARCYDPENALDFSLTVAKLGSVQETPTYTSAIGKVIEPGAPDSSDLIAVVSRRGGLFLHMPPLATEEVDEQGVNLLRRWVTEMRPSTATAK